MRTGISYNLKPHSTLDASLPGDAFEEFDSEETVEAIKQVLSKEGHEVFLLGGDLSIIDRIEKEKIEFVFNIAEGLYGRSREAHVPALLEWMQIPYSGSDPLSLALTLDKALTKRIVLSLGIATPEFWVINHVEDLESIPEKFPLFVKPVWEGSSKGVRISSKVQNHRELEKEVRRLFENYGDEPVLVEAYIEGRELTVGVLGNDPPRVLGIMEIGFQNHDEKDFCYSLEVKRDWKNLVEYHCPARLDATLQQKIGKSVLDLFRVLRLRDVARFDFRLNTRGELFFLEVNPLPGLSPESGDLVILSKKQHLSYEGLISKIFRAARSRYSPKLAAASFPVSSSA